MARTKTGKGPASQLPLQPAQKLRFRMKQGLLMASLAELGGNSTGVLWTAYTGCSPTLQGRANFSPHSLQVLPETSPPACTEDFRTQVWMDPIGHRGCRDIRAKALALFFPFISCYDNRSRQKQLKEVCALLGAHRLRVHSPP